MQHGRAAGRAVDAEVDRSRDGVEPGAGDRRVDVDEAEQTAHAEEREHQRLLQRAHQSSISWHSTTPTLTSSPTSSRGSSRECRRVVQLATGISSILARMSVLSVSASWNSSLTVCIAVYLDRPQNKRQINNPHPCVYHHCKFGIKIDLANSRICQFCISFQKVKNSNVLKVLSHRMRSVRCRASSSCSFIEGCHTQPNI